MLDKFAVFILSHGRPNSILTIDSLKRANYTGRYYIVIDNEDESIKEYKEKYGDKVIVFNKGEAAKITDEGDNFKNRKSPVFARNAIFDIAKNLEIDYFLQLDDDYTAFHHRWAEGEALAFCYVKEFDTLCSLMIEYLKNTEIMSVAFAQGGDFIGGVDGAFSKGILRKAMNTFFCKTDRRFSFVGKLNDDVNTYSVTAKMGNVFLTITAVSILQERTQAQPGGITDLYLEYGTYVKSFYTVMMNPSCTRIAMMGNSDRRFHHKILWDKCAPKILSEKFKKVKHG